MVRLPTASRALFALSMRLSSRSRLRRAALRRALVSGWDAATRGDYELMLVRYGPDVAVEFPPDFESLGMGGTFRGHDGLLAMTRTFDEAWEGRALFPEFVIDLGDRVLTLGTFHLPGSESGLEFESEFAQLIRLRAGLVAHEREFLTWDAALRAAGLDPDAIALPRRGATGHAASSVR